MKKNNVKNNNKIVIVFAFVIFTLMILRTTVYAYGHWTGSSTNGMPSNGSSPTGLLPQYFGSGRKFFGDADNEFPYDKWQTNIWTGGAFCAGHGKILRFGKFDPKRYYAELPNTIDEVKKKAEDKAKNEAYSKASSKGNPGSPQGNAVIHGNINENESIIITTQGGMGAGYYLEGTIKKVFSNIAANCLPGNIGDAAIDAGEGSQGPEVVIMEPSVGAAAKGTVGYRKVGGGTQNNNAFTFILTALEESYNKNIHERYSLSDVQAAYWMEVNGTGAATRLGGELYYKAHEYEDFVDKELKDIKNNVKINNKDAQVIVNQQTQEYTVGPFSIEYPYHFDISYLKALYIECDNGKELIYDENSEDFILKIDGEKLKGSNGLQKEYPAPNEKFYIQFLAAKANFPKRIKLNVDLEYLEYSEIEYNQLDAYASVYKYDKFIESGNARCNANCYWWKDVSVFDHNDENGNAIYRTERYEGFEFGKATETFLQAYVQMLEKPVRVLDGQEITITPETPVGPDIGSRRVYDVVHATPNEEIDLTIEIGGTVWVDGRAGKESKFDGKMNLDNDSKFAEPDKPMPNVKVSLYKVTGLDGNKQGTYEGSLLTDENGKYLFDDVNSMFQYYVKFTYNGQYYQPTIFDQNKESQDWKLNSKGLDVLEERDTYNQKFEEIGSAPENTIGCKEHTLMHTREELEKANLIDEFGNIKKELDENGNRVSEDNYVNESMMDSYTCNGTSTKTLYPGIEIFVIDTFLNQYTNTKEILEFVKTNKIEILYGNPDLVHYINQGYVLREILDLAIRKDVYETTLEINGKSETYKYNKREGLETDKDGNSFWEIKTRLSDGYYKYDYTRELFREDYDFKIDNYKMEDVKTTLDNLGLSYDSELKIYVTYKITLRNRSQNIATNVTELVDYYDKDYTFVPERSYLGDTKGVKVDELSFLEESKYGNNTETQIDGYKNLYIRGKEQGELPLMDSEDETRSKYLYLTFIVNKDGERNNIVDENIKTGEFDGVGKENIIEINGYKSYYGKKAESPNKGNNQTKEEYIPGDIAGLPDVNSVPGNLNSNDVPKDGKIKFENFENDTDKAPNIRLIFKKDTPRTAQGIVWEDQRNKEVESAKIGNGLREDEKGINGVRVQLVELRKGKDGIDYEYIWKEVYSGNKENINPIINNSQTIPQYQIDQENADGKYKFEAFIPGNYIVRFIYGSNESSVLGTKYINYNTGEEKETGNEVMNLYSKNGYKIRNDNNGYTKQTSNIGLNVNSYNGQDYKSTAYQIGVENGEGAYNNIASMSYDYNFKAAQQGMYSDAKDIMNKKQDTVINIAPNKEYLYNCSNSRKQVEEYSKIQKHNIAEILSSSDIIPEYNNNKYSFNEVKKNLDNLLNNTFMIAETGKIDVNFEYDRTGKEDNYTNTSDTGHDNLGNANYEMSGYYVLDNLDFGLQERPKAQLKTTKQIANIKVKLADGRVLFDASNKATNVLWLDHMAHGQDVKNEYKTNKNYKEKFMLNPIVRQQSTNKGKIQLTMDEELMHGANIQITYMIMVANIGEVDYNENKFYYTGIIENKNNIVKTNPNMLIDYVGTQVHDYNSGDDKTATRNNLEFSVTQNPDWKVISCENSLKEGYINNKLKENLSKYAKNHIIITDKISKDLKPLLMDENAASKIRDSFRKDPLNVLETVNKTSSVSGVKLILSKALTQDSGSDDRIYNNMTEIIQIKNDVGRRMRYSVIGNQDPTVEPREIDADDAQEVIILPPFGQRYRYYILGTIIAVIFIIGISTTIFIIKKKK